MVDYGSSQVRSRIGLKDRGVARCEGMSHLSLTGHRGVGAVERDALIKVQLRAGWNDQPQTLSGAATLLLHLAQCRDQLARAAYKSIARGEGGQRRPGGG